MIRHPPAPKGQKFIDEQDDLSVLDYMKKYGMPDYYCYYYEYYYYYYYCYYYYYYYYYPYYYYFRYYYYYCY